MNHRLLTFLILALAGIFCTSPSRAGERPPNVILILADDLGYHDLGCYGHPLIRTPVIDKLAADGIRLTGFHSGASVCTPSRMSLLTGAYATRLGWTEGVVGYKMGMHDGMSPEALTIAEIFGSEGYATAISGKWHIGDQPATRPPARGFGSTYYLTHSNNQVKKVWRGDEVVEDPFDNRLLTEQFTAEAIRFVKANRERPFFLYLPYTAPHFPVEPHPAWKGRSKFGVYGDVVEEMDARIGELLTALRELDREEETIIVFTSDNGPENGEQSSGLPFRGGKWSALEGGTRVPCIISWLGVIPAGQVIDSLFSAMDLLPSLSRACGIDWKSKTGGKPAIDGLDLWDSLLGKDGAPQRTELLHWHGMHAEPQAMRGGDWKIFFDRRNALEGPGTDAATSSQAEKITHYRQALVKDAPPSPFLLNLRDDPGETIDLSVESPEKTHALVERGKQLTCEIKAGTILPISKPQGKK
jgi:arylsulfatase A-like enzyme